LGAYARFDIVATEGQTAFAVDYYPGWVDVYYNGILLTPNLYTAENGVTVTLDNAAINGDPVTVIAWQIAGINPTGPTGPTGSSANTGNITFSNTTISTSNNAAIVLSTNSTNWNFGTNGILGLPNLGIVPTTEGTIGDLARNDDVLYFKTSTGWRTINLT
jgi:hypothetical protein